MCIISRSFTSHVQICNQTNIPLVAIENTQFSPLMLCILRATQQLLVGWLIWMREVNERLILYNLRIDHVMIRWQLTYWIAANAGGTIIWNRSLGTTQPKNHGFMSCPGTNPAKTKWVRFLAGSGTKANWAACQNPDCWPVTWTHC